MSKRKQDLSWVHRAAGMSYQFEAQDAGRVVAIDYTTVLGALPHVEGEESVYIVLIEATETESRGEYSWPITDHVTVTRNAEGEPITDDATKEQVRQVMEEGSKA